MRLRLAFIRTSSSHSPVPVALTGSRSLQSQVIRYAMQPQVIEGLAENAAFRGRGLLARFLYAAPQSWIGRRQIAPTPVSDATRQAYRQTVRELAAVVGEFVLQLAADASAALLEWEAEIEAMLADGGGDCCFR